MKKLLTLLLVLLLAAAPALAEGSINIYTWDGYFDPATIAAFTEETGIEVNLSPFASNEDMLVVMQSGAAYDLSLIHISHLQPHALRHPRRDGGRGARA